MRNAITVIAPPSLDDGDDIDAHIDWSTARLPGWPIGGST